MRWNRLSAVALAALLAAIPTWGQDPPPEVPPEEGSDVTAVVEGTEGAQLRLAFPAVAPRTTLTTGAASALEDFEQTLRTDLLRTGIFVIQGPDELEVLELTGDQATDFELYRSLANNTVLLAEAEQDGDRLVVEGRVYDLQSGQAILGKRYRGTYDLTTRMAHTFSDEVVLYFTGRRGIALTSLAFYSDRSGDKEIYLMDYDGQNARAITGHHSISMAPAWSPAGDSIAYVSFFNGPPGIYRVDLETGAKQPIVNDGSLSSAPGFSPDGSRIVFSHSLGGDTEIFVANRDGSNRQRLTRSVGIDTNPAWSPSGQQIAFTSSRAGNPHIYVMDVEGTNLRRVTFEGNYNDGAAWSPDGSRISYATRRGRDFDIAITDLSLLDTKVLTEGEPGSHESPTWSPDGSWIAFTTTVRGSTQIYVMSSQGGSRRALTSDGNNWAPDWSAYP